MSFFKALGSVCIVAALVSKPSLANTFPHGCEVTGFGFDQNHLIVNQTGAQAFYLIQNRTNFPIELQRIETREVFMSPPLTAKLDPANWGAFASDIANLHFQCFVRENDAAVTKDCRDVLEVCQYPRVKFALSNMGNYWVSTNKTQYDAINEAARKGILLRW
ncbi:MAG: enhanced entry protein EnhB [Tatlockia sp.]|jgi:hypothetical protein